MLLRHAKSSWTEPGIDDKDRPLNARGQRTAPVIGSYMAREKLVPDLALVSPARRARDTWKLASAALKTAPKTLIEDQLYDFGNGGRILDLIRSKADTASKILIVGHNPSLERLALRLIGKGEDKLRKRIADKYPTGALAIFEFDASSWKDVDDGKGTLTAFVRPRDLVKDG
jgi:phosphohistidine phosphatase